MTSTHDEDQKSHMALNGALDTYPVVSAPANFTTSVMNKVCIPEPKPQFRLSWIDYALTFFSTSMIYLLFFLWQLVPGRWIQVMRFQAYSLGQRNIGASDLEVLFIGTVLFFFVVTVSILLFRHPRSSITIQ
jgi:hypothetical protein